MKIAKKFMVIVFIAFAAALLCSVAVTAAVPVSAEPVSAVAACEEEDGEKSVSVELLANEAAVDENTSAESDESAATDNSTIKGIAAAVTIGIAALAGAVAMGIAIAKAMDGISRQPEAASNIRSTMMLGLVFVETVVIYALIVSVLLIFVL